MSGPRIGITLPSFVRDPGEVFAVAAAAEEAGLDGVFCYDHVFRVARDGTRRPALESSALLGAVARATTRLRVGVLVVRASLRPAAVTAWTLRTVDRISGARLVAGVGAGDHESAAENEQVGLPFGSMDDRLAQLRATVRASRDQGFPVWVGGVHPAVRALAAEEADGWNRWGGAATSFAAHAAQARARAARRPFTCSWGGLVVLAGDDDRARARAARLGAPPGTLVGGVATIAAAFREYHDAGAEWVIAGPVDSREPANAAVLGAVAAHLANDVGGEPLRR